MRTGTEAFAAAQALGEAIGLTVAYPKGVHRFASFEDAQAWMDHYRLESAVRRQRQMSAESSATEPFRSA